MYALSNSSFPELLKIGFSSKVPDARADELYTTGVPTPYELSYYCFVDDAKVIERRVHSMLSSYRHNKGREFFQIDVASLKRLISSLSPPDFEFIGNHVGTAAKSHQIIMVSRHGNEVEEQEMQQFSAIAKEAGLDAFVRELFYDSNSCCCKFQFSGDLQISDEITHDLYLIASNTLSQFEWFDSIEHGCFMPDVDDPSEL